MTLMCRLYFVWVKSQEWSDWIILCVYLQMCEKLPYSHLYQLYCLIFFTSSGLGYFLFQSFPAFDVFWFFHDSQSIQGELKPHCDFYFYV